MFDVEVTEIPGLLVLRPRVFTDERGSFVKTFHTAAFSELGLLPPAEEFYSTTGRSVIRGMHLQVDWPVADPMLSARDRALPSLAEFSTAAPIAVG